MMPTDCACEPTETARLPKETARLTTVTPAADILDDGENYHLVLELPGVGQEDLELTLEKDHLLVRASRGNHDESLQLLYDGRRVQRAFERRFSIGNGVDRENVSARLENGLLHVRLPRRAEEKRRRIEIAVQDRAD
jgi:HSP20 family molecular chaperone IbpA